MASLRKHNESRFFYACFTNAKGQRVQKSTKQSTRKAAQGVANAYEKAAKLGSEKRLGEAQARKVISEIYESVSGGPLPSGTVSNYLSKWVESRKKDTSYSTGKACAQVARDFLISLGERSQVDLSILSTQDVTKYRDEVAARTSPSTANKSLKILRSALSAAWREGLATDNVAAKVRVLERSDDQAVRRPFTLDELRRIYAATTGEWRGIFLFGLYAAGARLKDVATLTWRNIDLQAGALHYVTRKTGRKQNIPLSTVLLKYLEELPSSDDPNAPIFPESSKVARIGTLDAKLSGQFHDILVEVGLAAKRDHRETGLGRARKRAVSELSFHSLRHTATSLFKTSGVSHAVAQDLIGHETAAISQHYTHVGDQAKQAAVNLLPDITTPQGEKR